MVDIAKKIDGKKFMWDGYTYESEEKARQALENYKKNDFETKLLKEEDKFLVYTRRVVEEVVVEGETPI